MRRVRKSAVSTFTLRGYLETSRRIRVWPDSIQVLGGTLAFAAAHPDCGCGSHLVCVPSGAVTRRGSRGDCPARSSTAHLAVSIGSRDKQVRKCRT